MYESNNWFFEARISKETCESFIKEYYKPEQSTVGTVNGASITCDLKENSPVRDTKICWADSMSSLGLLLFNHILIANLKSGWNFDIEQMERVQIGEYSVGGFYDWHEDHSVTTRDGTNTQRKLSLSLFLSDPDTYEGGDLLLADIDKPIIKKQGSIIVFPSSIKHTITPVTSGVRYSAVAWARGPYLK